MPTFEQAFCLRHNCDKQQFRRAVFRRCLYPHAVPIAVVFGGLNARFFDADRELISGAALAADSNALSEEVRDFFEHSANRRWLRRYFRLRVSTSRLRRMARNYLTERGAVDLEAPAPRLLDHAGKA